MATTSALLLFNSKTNNKWQQHQPNKTNPQTITSVCLLQYKHNWQ